MLRNKMRLNILWAWTRRREMVVVAVLALFLVYLTSRSSADEEPEDGSPLTGDIQWRPLLIDTPGYQLPLLQPWDASVRHHLKRALDPRKDLACSSGILPVTWSRGTTVFLNLSLFGDSDVPTCCFSAISRVQLALDNYTKEADRLYRVEEKCQHLSERATIIDAQAVFIKCTRQDQLLYKNVHPLIDLKPFRRKMIKKWGDKGCQFHPYALDGRDGLMTNNGTSKKSGTRESSLSGIEHRHSSSGAGESITTENYRALQRELLLQGSARSKASEGGRLRGRVTSIPYSVVIFGIDSLSRQNLQRYMPRTFELLKKADVIDLQGFNKVGDNTFPNLMPVLAGMSGPDVDLRCLGGDKWKALDNCSFIWKNFSEHGYLTVMGEDAPHMSVFHNDRTGFVTQPTDLSLRSSFLASEELISHTGKLEPTESIDHFCQGPLSSFEFVKQYSVGVANMLGCLPYFGFYWASKITHDNNHYASLIDHETLEYLKLFLSQPDFSRTFLFFMSDHGLRFGDIRKTEIGRMEDSLPFMYLLVPAGFRESYPVAFESLKANQNRLTSHYDIHATLWDILRKEYQDEAYTKQVHVVRRSFPGLSLFRRIPDTRTCEDAGIPSHFCAGMSFHPVKITDRVVEAAARFVYRKLNRELKEFPRCSQFTGYKVWKAMAGSGKDNIIRIWFQTMPGNAELEATVIKAKKSFRLTADVSRLNSYKGQSDCIKDGKYSKYCFCKWNL